MQESATYFPHLGFGLGLRTPYYAHIFGHWPQVDWFEIISENFMDTDGKAKRNLARIAERYPIVMHGVALSIGTIDPLNSEYLHKLKKLIEWVRPAWISDHLCWTGVAHKNSHDLLPVPYTEEALAHIVTRIGQVQDYLGRPIALENPSTYLEFKSSHIPEAEFLASMAQQSGCQLLLDVNNVYVTCYNHRLDAKAYIDALPLDKVAQIHLSGHSNMGTHIIDTHDNYVVDEVWTLYRYALHKAGRTINTMVEWDDKIPSWDVLYGELTKAKVAAADAHNYAPFPDLAQTNPSYIANITTDLRDSQLRMQNAILLDKNADEPAAWIRAKDQFSPAEQLAVYVNAYRYRLYNVTAEDYPVLKHYLGEALFDTVLTAFVNTAQSNHFNIGRYAAQLPEFISRHSATDAMAHELAILENAVAQLTDPEETRPLTPEDLQDVTADTLMEYLLYPRKALQLFAFEYPVNDYYIAVKEGRLPPAPALQKSFLAVFRHEDVVWRMPLAEQEYYLLQKLFSGMAIGESFDLLQTEQGISEEELGANLTQWFSRWIRNGLLAKGEYRDEPLKKDVA